MVVPLQGRLLRGAPATVKWNAASRKGNTFCTRLRFHVSPGCNLAYWEAEVPGGANDADPQRFDYPDSQVR